MTDARAYRCPVCGGPCNEGTPACEFCQTPIATLRCIGCYLLNIPEALHCRGCGRELGLEPLALGAGVMCPRCEGRCKSFGDQLGTLSECPECAGQFVEHALLRELIERRAVYQGVVSPSPRQYNPLEQPVRYVACPACSAMMNRKNFGGSSGVVVDVCSLHGVWFDSGELPKILAFVRSGGLERARRRKQEEQRRPNPELGALSEGARVSMGGGASDLAWVDILSDAGLALLDFTLDAVDKLRR